MSLYLDASVLVALLVDDALTERADALLLKIPSEVVVSDFAAAEVASSIARKVRTRRLTVEEGCSALVALDGWSLALGGQATINSADVAMAAAYLRRLDLNLRTPDAIHIAMAQRLGAELATFDDRMADCAGALGVVVREV